RVAGEVLDRVAELGLVDQPAERALPVAAAALVDRGHELPGLVELRVDLVEPGAGVAERRHQAGAGVAHPGPGRADRAVDPVERAQRLGAAGGERVAD